MSRKMWVLFFLFFLSRIFFINPGPIFFDSPEYLRRLSETNLWIGLTDGHIPLHSGYVFLFWLPYHLFGAYLIIFLQIILAYFALVALYRILIYVFDTDLALKSIIIFSLTPLFWITNESIMMETTYVSFFVFFLYFHLKYARSKKPNIKYLLLGNLCFVLSFLTHTVIVLWLTFYLVLMIMFNKKLLRFFIINLSVTLLGVSVINAFFITSFHIQKGLSLLYFYKLNEHAQLSFNLQSFFITIRNTFIPLFRNYTFLLVVLSFTGLLALKKNRKFLFLFIFWLAPVIITNQWWDSLFYGRHSLIAGIGISVLAAYVLRKRKSIYILTIIYLLVVSLPALSLLKKDIPYIIESNAVRSLQPNGLLIETHFARPQIEHVYHGDVYFVDEPRNQGDLKQKITNYLNKNLPVFVTSQALSEPYGLYSGPYLHVLSLSYKKDFVLKSIISRFKLKEYKVINREDNLILYKVISSESSEYPKVPDMLESKRRMDYYDPFTRLWLFTRDNFNLRIPVGI